MRSKRKLSAEEFVLLAIETAKSTVPQTPYLDKAGIDTCEGRHRVIHSVMSGLNEALRLYFPGKDPVEITTRLASAGKISMRRTYRGALIALPGVIPEIVKANFKDRKQ